MRNASEASDRGTLRVGPTTAGLSLALILSAHVLTVPRAAAGQQGANDFMRSVFPGDPPVSRQDSQPASASTPDWPLPTVDALSGDAPIGHSASSRGGDAPVPSSIPTPDAVLSRPLGDAGPIDLFPHDAAGDGDASLDETVIRATTRQAAGHSGPASDARGDDETASLPDAVTPEPEAPPAKPSPPPKRNAKPKSKKPATLEDREFADWDKELESKVDSVAFTDDKGNAFEGRESGDGIFVGVIEYKGGGRYEGEAVKGKREGRGTMSYPGGGRYTGAWRDDKWHGEGVGIAGNGNRYEGTYVQGKKHGRGIYTWSEGDRYEGMFRNGLPHGEGIKLYDNGDRYEGNWRSGLRHGEGEMAYANGDRYIGAWKHDKYHGEGLYDWAAGHRYDGEWEKGLRHGGGVFDFASGKRYEGEWGHDYRHGIGTETLPTGERWKGNWYFDEPRGRPDPSRNQASTRGNGEN